MDIRQPSSFADFARLTFLLEQYPIEKFYAASPNIVVESLVNRVATKRLQCLMAWDGADAIGFLLYFYNSLQSECVFCDLFVDANHRGGNVGPMLIEKAKDEALAAGLTFGRWQTSGISVGVIERLCGGSVSESITYLWRMEK